MQKRALRVAPGPEPTRPQLDSVGEQLNRIAGQLLALGQQLAQAVEMPVAPEPALLLSPEEAAAVLGVGRSTVYRLMESGELRRVSIGRCARIPRADIDRYVAFLLAEGA